MVIDQLFHPICAFSFDYFFLLLYIIFGKLELGVPPLTSQTPSEVRIAQGSGVGEWDILLVVLGPQSKFNTLKRFSPLIITSSPKLFAVCRLEIILLACNYWKLGLNPLFEIYSSFQKERCNFSPLKCELDIMTYLLQTEYSGSDRGTWS